jgi:RNA polymerase-binding transcription factor DksA
VLTFEDDTAPQSSQPVDAGEAVKHVGNSNFEGWYQEYAARITGNPKQTARDAYAAGLNEAEQERSTGICFFCGEPIDGKHESDCPQATATQPAQTEQALTDGERLDWLDSTNKPFKMGWRVGVAPAGNVSVGSVIQLGDSITPIRAAIDAAIAAAQPASGDAQ